MRTVQPQFRMLAVTLRNSEHLKYLYNEMLISRGDSE